MITREQIEKIQTESREKGVSIKKLLEEVLHVEVRRIMVAVASPQKTLKTTPSHYC